MLALEPETRTKLDQQVEALAREVAARVPGASEQELVAAGEAELDRLIENARFADFLTVLVHRRLRARAVSGE